MVKAAKSALKTKMKAVCECNFPELHDPPDYWSKSCHFLTKYFSGVSK